MNCTSGILQPMNSSSGKKLVFIAAWKALFPVDCDEAVF
jgi:hypothetical protein